MAPRSTDPGVPGRRTGPQQALPLITHKPNTPVDVKFYHHRDVAKSAVKNLRLAIDDTGAQSQNDRRVKPELRALVRSEIRRSLAGSALQQYPGFTRANKKFPELQAETEKLLFHILEDVVPRLSNVSCGDDDNRLRRRKTAPQLVDPETGLDLMPPAKHLYQQRERDFGAKFSPEQFLKLVWQPHVEAHLLYSEHLRRVDRPLYAAFAHKAAADGFALKNYLFSLGIMTRERVTHAPAGLERQARLLRDVRAFLRVEGMKRSMHSDVQVTSGHKR